MRDGYWIAGPFRMFLPFSQRNLFGPFHPFFRKGVRIVLASEHFNEEDRGHFERLFAFLGPFQRASATSNAIFFMTFPTKTYSMSTGGTFCEGRLRLLNFRTISVGFKFSRGHERVHYIGKGRVIQRRIFYGVGPGLKRLIRRFAFFKGQVFRGVVRYKGTIDTGRSGTITRVVRFAGFPQFGELVFFRRALPIPCVVVSVLSMAFRLCSGFRRPFLRNVLCVFCGSLCLLPHQFPLPNAPRF